MGRCIDLPQGPVMNPFFIGHFIAHPDPPKYYPSVISMNPAWRNTLANLIVVSAWPDGIPRSLIDAVYQDVTYNKTEPLRKLSPDTGAYFNEADSREPNWQQAFFGKNYGRLKRIKEKYDPKNVLWCRSCVGSEALIEQPDGSLCRPGYGRRTEDGQGGKIKRDSLAKPGFHTNNLDSVGNTWIGKRGGPYQGQSTGDIKDISDSVRITGSEAEGMQRANKREKRGGPYHSEGTDSVRITQTDPDDMQRANRKDRRGGPYETKDETTDSVRITETELDDMQRANKKQKRGGPYQSHSTGDVEDNTDSVRITGVETEDMQRANKKQRRGPYPGHFSGESKHDTDSVGITGGEAEDMQRANRKEKRGGPYETQEEATDSVRITETDPEGMERANKREE